MAGEGIPRAKFQPCTSPRYIPSVCLTGTGKWFVQGGSLLFEVLAPVGYPEPRFSGLHIRVCLVSSLPQRSLNNTAGIITPYLQKIAGEST